MKLNVCLTTARYKLHEGNFLSYKDLRSTHYTWETFYNAIVC